MRRHLGALSQSFKRILHHRERIYYLCKPSPTLRIKTSATALSNPPFVGFEHGHYQTQLPSAVLPEQAPIADIAAHHLYRTVAGLVHGGSFGSSSYGRACSS